MYIPSRTIDTIYPGDINNLEKIRDEFFREENFLKRAECLKARVKITNIIDAYKHGYTPPILFGVMGLAIIIVFVGLTIAAAKGKIWATDSLLQHRIQAISLGVPGPLFGVMILAFSLYLMHDTQKALHYSKDDLRGIVLELARKGRA